MRKHGWQLPYHPLQVVAVAVFLALGFAFYVFFAPFVGKKMYQYIAMGIYTPLIASVFGLYIWCAAADPADTGVFRSKKYLKVPETKQLSKQKDSAKGAGSTSPFMHNENAVISGEKSLDNNPLQQNSSVQDLESSKKNTISKCSSPLLLVCSPCACLCKCGSRGNKFSEQQMSEDGMFYCSLCEVEVFKYSKHCRVCDKCVDSFDHHCRWLNNCIGKKNYRQFFILMVSALLLLILQWSTGILVLVLCFLEGKRFSADISSKLGSSFSLAPFVIVVGICSILAMLATLPVAQLFFFHILLIKKGISTYDYIVALREQEQEQELGGGQQSPQMSMVSSLTGLSSVSSFNTFHRGAWCTPPRMFLEDQFDVVPPETASVSSFGKKTALEETTKKKNPQVKISPWALARLNAEEVSKAAAEAKKKSKILRPVARRDNTPFGLEATSSFGSSDRRMLSRFDTSTSNIYNTSKRRGSKRVRLPAELPLESLMDIQAKPTETATSSSALAPLQLEARSAFQTSRGMSSSGVIVASSSSPESSFDSPDIHPFRVSSSGADDLRRLPGLSSSVNLLDQREMVLPFSRSTSDGYDASGGEDSDQVPSRSIHRLR